MQHYESRWLRDWYTSPVIIDEVQRAPDLLRAIKRVVDRDHKPGQFVLTGSANLVTLKTVSESLAGRVVLHELYPFSWADWVGREPHINILRDLFECENSKDILLRLPRSFVADRREEIKECILAGGYPTRALMKSARSRTRWFEAIGKRMILDQDQDSVFTGYAWTGQLLLEDRVRLSYALRGFQDNPEMESFFSRFKEEGRSLFLDAQSIVELAAVVDSRMVYYNTERRHSSLGYMPPLTYIERVRSGSATGSPS